MSPVRIKTFLDAEPFQPFTILKGDGQQVNVVDRKLALLYPGGRTLHVVTPRFGGARHEEDFEDHFIDVFLVTDVVKPLRARSKRSGKKH